MPTQRVARNNRGDELLVGTAEEPQIAPGEAMAGRARALSALCETRCVRKQYHFWPGHERLDAWDVDRLIALSRELPVIEIDPSAVGEVDSVYWFDAAHQPTVRAVIEHLRLIADVDLAYPVILGPDGRVMDGMHRIARALLDGRPAIPAVRFDELPAPDFRDCDPGDLPYDR